MTRFTATVIGLCGCLLVLPCTVPVLGAPFFVRVYGRTYKVDSRNPIRYAGGRQAAGVP